MDLKDWIGRTETVDDIVAAMPYAALSATLDREPARPKPGTPLPALWHWLYFLPLHRQSEIGPDGHAKRGGFLPPVPLPRRMWAGSQLQFHRPLCVGDAVTRNRVRRRLRAALHEQASELEPGAAYLVRATPGAADSSYAELSDTLRAILGQLSVGAR